jgi:hypothetical protein
MSGFQGRVHRGFFESFQRLWPQLVQALTGQAPPPNDDDTGKGA